MVMLASKTMGLLVTLDDTNGSKIMTVAGDLHTTLQLNSQLPKIRTNSVGLLVPGEVVAAAGLARKVLLPRWTDTESAKGIRDNAVKHLKEFTALPFSPAGWASYRDQIVRVATLASFSNQPGSKPIAIAAAHLPGIISTTTGKMRAQPLGGTSIESMAVDDLLDEADDVEPHLFLSAQAGGW